MFFREKAKITFERELSVNVNSLTHHYRRQASSSLYLGWGLTLINHLQTPTNRPSISEKFLPSKELLLNTVPYRLNNLYHNNVALCLGIYFFQNRYRAPNLYSIFQMVKFLVLINFERQQCDHLKDQI